MSELEDKVKQLLLARGFEEVRDRALLKKLMWRPDFVVALEGYTYPTEVKGNLAVLPSLLNRISQASSDTVSPLVIFPEMPRASMLRQMSEFGISNGYLKNGEIASLELLKRRPKSTVRKEVRRKLQQIDIFVSSRQEIEERKFVAERLEYHRKASSFPFGPPILIEHDKFHLNDLYGYIDEQLENADWFVNVLEDHHSDVVSYEIMAALDKIDHDNIFMFVKETAACKDAWNNELETIRQLPARTVKYLPYSNLTELEVDLAKAVNRRMREISKSAGIPLFREK